MQLTASFLSPCLLVALGIFIESAAASLTGRFVTKQRPCRDASSAEVLAFDFDQTLATVNVVASIRHAAKIEHGSEQVFHEALATLQATPKQWYVTEKRNSEQTDFERILKPIQDGTDRNSQVHFCEAVLGGRQRILSLRNVLSELSARYRLVIMSHAYRSTVATCLAATNMTLLFSSIFAQCGNDWSQEFNTEKLQDTMTKGELDAAYNDLSSRLPDCQRMRGRFKGFNKAGLGNWLHDLHGSVYLFDDDMNNHPSCHVAWEGITPELLTTTTRVITRRPLIAVASQAAGVPTLRLVMVSIAVAAWSLHMHN